MDGGDGDRDLLFSVVNLSRYLGIISALHRSNEKMKRRFPHVCISQSAPVPLGKNISEMEALWQEVKGHEREGNKTVISNQTATLASRACHQNA